MYSPRFSLHSAFVALVLTTAAGLTAPALAQVPAEASSASALAPEAGAQVREAPAKAPVSTAVRRNVIRLDLLAPVVFNVSNTLFNTGFVYPVLVSYERQLDGQWSLGAEALFNGGDRTDRRSGAGLIARYYTKKADPAVGLMTGFYCSPVVSYRALASTYLLDGNLVTRGKRVGAGLMIGYQLPLGRPGTSRVALDMSMGLLSWSRIGTDRSEVDPAQPNSSGPDLKQTGPRPDFRLGIGFRL